MRKVISTLALSILFYQIYPYVNALGCNFTYVMTSQHTSEFGRCNMGVFNSTSKVNDSALAYYSKYIFGVDSDYFYFILWSRKKIPYQPSTPNVDALKKIKDYGFNHAASIYDGDTISIARYKCPTAGECLLFFENEMENIYTLKLSGRQSFFW
ncbi:hypothetical protein H9X98_10210 [Aeromonas jandaei]|uniref:hypothetical protein n=1 Tax=Aeromonas jandaei TaxID=650 RepID=UPI001F207FE2|nr:hypothetical protein [Aeromonas jandaei]MCF7718068.1 hypothetical protein [Aeromonas jandaei]